MAAQTTRSATDAHLPSSLATADHAQTKDSIRRAIENANKKGRTTKMRKRDESVQQ